MMMGWMYPDVMKPQIAIPQNASIITTGTRKFFICKRFVLICTVILPSQTIPSFELVRTLFQLVLHTITFSLLLPAKATQQPIQQGWDSRFCHQGNGFVRDRLSSYQ